MYRIIHKEALDGDRPDIFYIMKEDIVLILYNIMYFKSIVLLCEYIDENLIDFSRVYQNYDNEDLCDHRYSEKVLHTFETIEEFKELMCEYLI